MADEFTSLEKLMNQGKELGYDGDNLRRFVEDQQKLERDERAERRRIESEQLQLKRLNMEAEAEKLKLEVELEQLRIRAPWATGGTSMNDQRADSSSMIASGYYSGQGGAPRPQLPKFEERQDSIDAYLDRFEAFAENQGWQEVEWSMILSALLTGKALDIFSTLSKVDQRNYGKLREALLRGYDLTEEGFRQKFRQAKIEAGETYRQFGVRVGHYVSKWLELSGVGDDFEKLKDLMIQEQIISGCGHDLTVFLRERKPKTTTELLEAAEVYREARSDPQPTRYRQSRPGETTDRGQFETRQSPTRRSDRPECFLCHKVGHFAKDCRYKPHSTAAMEVGESWRSGPDRRQPETRRSPTRWSGRPECFLCHRVGHLARDCRYRPHNTAAMEVRWFRDHQQSKPIGNQSWRPERNATEEAQLLDYESMRGVLGTDR